MRLIAIAAAGLLSLITFSVSHAAAERGECTPTKLLWKTDDTPQEIKPLNRPVDLRGGVQSFVVAGPEPGCVIVQYSVTYTGGYCGDPVMTFDGDDTPDFRSPQGAIWLKVAPGEHQVKLAFYNRRCDDEAPYEDQIARISKRTILIQRD